MKNYVLSHNLYQFFFFFFFFWGLFFRSTRVVELPLLFPRWRKNGRAWKLNFCEVKKNIFWWSELSYVVIKGWTFTIKSFSERIILYFSSHIAVNAYVGENWLFQYTIEYRETYMMQHETQHNAFGKRRNGNCFYDSEYEWKENWLSMFFHPLSLKSTFISCRQNHERTRIYGEELCIALVKLQLHLKLPSLESQFSYQSSKSPTAAPLAVILPFSEEFIRGDTAVG